MIKKYIVATDEYQIREITAEKETFRCMWVDGVRLSKNTKSRLCFDSFDDAKSYLINKAAEGVGSAQNKLILACSIQQGVLRLSDGS